MGRLRAEKNRNRLRRGGLQLVCPLSLTSPAWNIQSLPIKYLTLVPPPFQFGSCCSGSWPEDGARHQQHAEAALRLEGEATAAGVIWNWAVKAETETERQKWSVLFSKWWSDRKTDQHLAGSDLRSVATLYCGKMCLMWNSVSTMNNVEMMTVLYCYWGEHKFIIYGWIHNQFQVQTIVCTLP